MNDIEITKLCAQAMGIKIAHTQIVQPVQIERAFYLYHPIGEPVPLFAEYDPLHDDAQAMALVKKFDMSIRRFGYDGVWQAWMNWSEPTAFGKDLNRAICECVAKMQKEKA